MRIVSRASWGARPPKSPPHHISTPSRELWLHHSASPSGGAERIRSIQRFHQDARVWNDIAYSYLIAHDGTVYEGRGPGIAGGHTKGHNTISHAICLLGNLNSVNPTSAALESLVWLVQHGHAEGWWPLGFTGGHRDTRGGGRGDCPGDRLYAQLPEINQAIRTNTMEDDMLPIGPTSSPEEIRLVQQLLSVSYGANVAESGNWDTATREAVELHLASFTGDPLGQRGDHVNGRMFAGLLGRHAQAVNRKAIAGAAAGGASAAVVIAEIVSRLS